MKVMLGDTVVLKEESGNPIAIVTQRSGGTLTVRRPDRDNQLEKVQRDAVAPLALKMAQAREDKTRFSNSLSLTGSSTLAELVGKFGYSADVRMKRNSLDKVVRQLQRAGLEVEPSSDAWDRNDTFALHLKQAAESGADPIEDEDEADASELLVKAALPEPFWPSALGLPADREVAFLRALTAREPILALLYLPEDVATQGWLQATWEGVMTWAFHGAQRFVRVPSDHVTPRVVRGPAGLLHGYLKPTAITSDAHQLQDMPHHLNLVSLRQDSESPVDFSRLKAAWPGPIFEFDGSEVTQGGTPLAQLLLLVGGTPDKARDGKVASRLSALKTLHWAREASAQVQAQAVTQVGEVLTGSKVPRLKGSSEGGTALTLKAHLAHWVQRRNPKAQLKFEARQEQDPDEDGDARQTTRVDLLVDGEGVFEVETLAGSGPMEGFYHQKVFSRVKRKESFSLVVPGEALLWAGPFLADIAYHLGENGRVLLPAAGGACLQLTPRAFTEGSSQVAEPEEEARRDSPLDREAKPAEQAVKLADIAGYSSAKERIERSILWPERHRGLMRGVSRASGILFYGPPGCGKSRLARAIAGELAQEVRLLGPSDLRGPYIGWGQLMIREQFDWVAEREKRMLVIDELDAVARSRRSGQMHEDDRASVNELLVQLDRASRLGRLVVGTTNYVSSLDDAAIRSGRFGLFVPVPPPDLDEAVAILAYYLERLTRREGLGAPEVTVPARAELRSALAPLFESNIDELRFFCGADLEAAVNETFLHALQQVLPSNAPPPVGTRVAVTLSVAMLASTLSAGPRSVDGESVRSFLEETQRHCGRGVADSLHLRFGAASSLWR
ncbi:AAA family ATPase [Pyxidicoccus sp. 3LG]